MVYNDFMSANFDQLLLSSQELLSIKYNFIQEIQRASEGKESSVSFLRHTIPQSSPLKDEEIFQVMTIGGSIFKTALVKKKESECVILSEKNDAIPPFGSDQIFLAFIASHLDPSITYLSLNLAYPLQPTFKNNLLDGILLHGTKEHTFIGLTGKVIGAGVEEYVNQIQQRTIKVTVANDTVCLFLSDVSKRTWSNTVAGIIGTGTNYAFGINNKVINLECGHFDQFDQTASGKLVDANSINPGKQLIEKEIAGAYLFQHFNIHAKENNIDIVLRSTKELSALAENNDGEASYLAQTIMERSASFAACQIAGIIEFKQQTNPGHFTFVMEGGLFWEGWNYKAFLEKYLKILGIDKLIKFSPVRHHSIRGGIKLLTGLS